MVMGNSTIKQKKRILSFFTFVFVFFGNLVGFAQAGVGINTSDPKSTLEINGSMGQKVTAITSSTTLDATDNTVVCQNTSAITISLPAVSTCEGRVYTIKKDMSSTNNVTIDADGSETIDGAATYTLSDVQGALPIASNGTEWKIISDHLSSCPMGEVSYFDMGGTNIGITLRSDGSSNMVVCRPATTLLNRGEFDNGGSNNGRLGYVGKNSKIFHIACAISGTIVSSTNKTLVFGIAQNGTVQTSSKVLNRFASDTDVQSTSLHVMLTLAPNDYLEFFVGNTTDAIDFKSCSNRNAGLNATNKINKFIKTLIIVSKTC
jgi:hypothetical protein